MTTENTKRAQKYHTKAVFALFLNMAEYNLNKIITACAGKDIKPEEVDEEIIEKLETKYLRIFSDEENKDKIKLIKLFSDEKGKLKNLRDFFSHNYHHDNFEIDKVLADFITKKFNEAKLQLERNYTKNELSHIDITQEDYQLFETVNGKQIFAKNGKAIIMLASFFLTKEQSETMVGSSRGFKKSFDKKSQATRECFTFWHLKNPVSDLKSQDTVSGLFLKIITDLTKFPKHLVEHLDNEKLIFRLTELKLNYIKVLDKETFEKLESIKDVDFKGLGSFKNKLKELKVLDSFENQIIEIAKEVEIRNKNKFAQYALTYINIFNLLPEFVFKTYHVEIKKSPTLNQNTALEKKSKFIENIDFNSDLYKGFVVKNNNVIFQLKNFNFWFLNQNDVKSLNKKFKVEMPSKAKDIFRILNQLKNKYLTSENEFINEFENQLSKINNQRKNNITITVDKATKKKIVEKAKKSIKGTIAVKDLYSLVYSLIFETEKTQKNFKNYVFQFHNLVKELTEGKKPEISKIKEQFTNIGNFEFKQNDLPAAILNYLQPKKFSENEWKSILGNKKIPIEDNIVLKIIADKTLYDNVLNKEYTDFDRIIKLANVENEKQEILLQIQNWLKNQNPNFVSSNKYVYNQSEWEKILFDEKKQKSFTEILKTTKEEFKFQIIDRFIKTVSKAIQDRKELFIEIFKGNRETLKKIIQLFDKDENQKLEDAIILGLGIPDSYTNAVYKKNVIEKLYQIKENNSKPENYSKLNIFQKVDFVVSKLAHFKYKKGKEKYFREIKILKEIFDKEWYQKTSIAVRNLNYQKLSENINFKNDPFNLMKLFKIGDFDKFFDAFVEKINDWASSEIEKIKKSEFAYKLDETAEILKLKPQTNDFQNLIPRFSIYLQSFAIPSLFFVRCLQKYDITKANNFSRTLKIAFNKENIRLNKQYDNIIKIEKTNGKHQNRNNQKINTLIYQQKNEDMILVMIAKKLFNSLISNQNIESNFKIKSTSIENIFNEGIIQIEKSQKKINFKIKYFNKIQLTVNSKNFDLILKNYCENKKELDYTEYEVALKKVKSEQKRIVECILILEKQIFYNEINNNLPAKITDIQKLRDKLDFYFEKNYNFYLPKGIEEFTEIEKKKIEETINKKDNTENYILLHEDGNRIETRTLFSKINVLFDTKLSGAKLSLFEYRKTAFHNGIPDTGTFADGINLIKQHLKPEYMPEYLK